MKESQERSIFKGIFSLGIFLILFIISGLYFMGNKINKTQEESQPAKVVEVVKIEADFTTILNRVMDLQPLLDVSVAEKVTHEVINNSLRYSLPISLILHLIYVESSFDPMVTSKSGAVGLMQVMYDLHKRDGLTELEKISKRDLYQIHNNIAAGCAILRKYMVRSKWNVREGLDKYFGTNPKIDEVLCHMATWEVQRFRNRKEN